jgi:hypothetical protein
MTIDEYLLDTLSQTKQHVGAGLAARGEKSQGSIAKYAVGGVS